MIWRKTKKPQKTELPDIHKLDFEKLPILQAQDIIRLLSLESRLKSIEILTGAGTEYYQLLYAPALNRYIESVQLVPASASHHHAGPGGLVAHTLDVIDIALRKRKSYNLPQHSTPETISEQEHVWTYAVFSGSLLHDIGKLVCNTRIILSTGATWTPHDSSLLESGATHYKVVFDKARYKLHTQLSNAFFHLLPPKGRGWLAQYTDILAQMTAWLAGDYYEWGVIGEIVRQADRESVAKNLKLGGDRERFPNAPTVPLVDRLTTALRQLLDEGQLKINRPDGSAGWCDGSYTYMVCGTVADAVRGHLYNSGATDVPVDNSRIFDTWQEHGFVVNTPRDGAIWHLTINNKLTLTVLKFETSRIFHPSRSPEIFAGSLSVSDKKPGRKPTPVETVGSSNTPTQTSKSVGPSKAHFFAEKNKETVDVQQDDHHVNNIYMVDCGDSEARKPNSAPNSCSLSQKTVATSFTLEDPEIAQHFLEWIKSGLKDNRILVNRSDALLHIVNEGALIVSPLAFKQFARQFGLVESGGDKQAAETNAATKIQKKLERMMTKIKMHRKTKRGLNIHTYLVKGEHKESKIRGWLLPVSCIFGDAPHPNPNTILSNISGFKEVEKKNNSAFFLGITDN